MMQPKVEGKTQKTTINQAKAGNMN